MGQEEIYTVRRLEPDIWAIEERDVRCFCIIGHERVLLVDTGYGGGDLAAVVRRIINEVSTEENYWYALKKKQIIVINTHADWDHVGGNYQFDNIYMHPSEYTHYYQRCKRPQRPTPIWDGAIISLGDMEWEVVTTPGHTPGSVCLLERNRRILIAGDVICTGDIYLWGPGRNLPAYIDSLNKLISLNSWYDKILCSHDETELDPEYVYKVRTACGRLAAGQLESEAPPIDRPCRLYRDGDVRILYDSDTKKEVIE